MDFQRNARRIRKIALLLAVATTLVAAETNPGVLPPNAKPFGMSYAQWGVAWWQWVFSLHANVPPNPILTTGSVDCSYAQSGHVWFLVGGLAGGTVARFCTSPIPPGTWLFLPILNAWADNVAVNPPNTVAELVGIAKELSDATELHASIDGVQLQDLSRYRAAFAPFTYTYPATDNILQSLGADAPGKDWPNTTVFPAASDGYWLMLEPLPPGMHTINFGGTTKNGFTIDVTYGINVGRGR